MAEKKLLQLVIAKVDGMVFSGLVNFVHLPGTEGEMTLLANHEPFISALKEGKIIYKPEEGEEKVLEIKSGTVEVRDNVATVLI